MSEPYEYDPHERKVLADIDAVGWSIIGVNADDHGPAFAYSIGMMHTLDHPEVIVFGLDVDLMGELINGMGRQVREGRRFDQPVLYEDLIEGFACQCLPMAERHHKEYLGYAMWHRRHVGKIATLRALQLIWPDKTGLFPNESGCNRTVVDLQPLLQT